MPISNLQNIFNKVLAGETVYLLLESKGQYDSTRVALLRKFRILKGLFDGLGADNPYEGQFFQCSFEKDLIRGRFQLAGDASRKNLPSRTYNVQDL